MKKFKFSISIPAKDQAEAEIKMQAISTVAGALTTDELKKISEVVSNPIQLALIKAKLG